MQQAELFPSGEVHNDSYFSIEVTNLKTKQEYDFLQTLIDHIKGQSPCDVRLFDGFIKESLPEGYACGGGAHHCWVHPETSQIFDNTLFGLWLRQDYKKYYQTKSIEDKKRLEEYIIKEEEEFKQTQITRQKVADKTKQKENDTKQKFEDLFGTKNYKQLLELGINNDFLSKQLNRLGEPQIIKAVENALKALETKSRRTKKDVVERVIRFTVKKTIKA